MTARISFTAGVLALGLLLAGCESLPRTDSAQTGPFFTPTNVRGVERLSSSVRRIAILPAAGLPTVPEDIVGRLDDAFYSELNRTARAETVSVSRDVLARLTGSRQLNSTAALPHDLLAKLKGSTRADAVLFVDMTAHSAYPPLVLGIRAKLIDLTSGDILWAFDNLFDANESSVANAARRHFLSTNSSPAGSGNLSAAVLQNPTRFGAYVAAATFATLPPR